MTDKDYQSMEKEANKQIDPLFHEIDDEFAAHNTAPTIAPAMTDEGYQSMAKTEDAKHGDNDAESNADSVRTDNRDSSLPQSVKEYLSALFAQEVLDNIETGQEELEAAMETISPSLPGLLKEFSTLVACNASPGVEEKACVFVRHQRK